MAQLSPHKPSVFEPKRVALGTANGSRFPSRFLVVDRTQTAYRVAYWRTLKQGELVLPLLVPTEIAWLNATGRQWVPVRDRREHWKRSAAQGVTLADALRLALDDAPESWRVIEEYIRLTSWGAELP